MKAPPPMPSCVTIAPRITVHPSTRTGGSTCIPIPSMIRPGEKSSMSARFQMKPERSVPCRTRSIQGPAKLSQAAPISMATAVPRSCERSTSPFLTASLSFFSDGAKVFSPALSLI